MSEFSFIIKEDMMGLLHMPQIFCICCLGSLVGHMASWSKKVSSLHAENVNCFTWHYLSWLSTLANHEWRTIKLYNDLIYNMVGRLTKRSFQIINGFKFYYSGWWKGWVLFSIFFFLSRIFIFYYPQPDSSVIISIKIKFYQKRGIRISHSLVDNVFACK